MRSIIDLPQEDLDALAEISRREGISRAEAVRRAVRAYLRSKVLEAPDEVFGLWKTRGIDALEYEHSLRSEWEKV